MQFHLILTSNELAVISPIWGLIGRVPESQPTQVAGCLPWEIFQNPPWKTPTHTRQGTEFIHSAFNSPPLAFHGSHRGCARKILHSSAAFPSAPEDRPRTGPQMCSPGWKQPGWIYLPRREVIHGKAWSAFSVTVHLPSCPHPHHSYSQPCLPEKGGFVSDLGTFTVHSHLMFSNSSLVNLKNY